MPLAIALDAFILAPRAKRIQLCENNGCRFIDTPQALVRVRDYGGDGPAVLFAPDPPNAVEHYDRLAALLAPKRRVLVMDLPGFGLSIPKRGFRFTIAEQAAAVTRALDELGVNDVTLAFNCVGGFLALALAKALPQRVTRILLCQTPSHADVLAWADRVDKNRLIRTPIAGQAIMLMKKRTVADGWYRAALPKGSDTTAYLSPTLDVFDRGGCYCLASALQTFSKSNAEQFNGIAQDTTVIWGKRDRTHRPTEPDSIQAHIPHARIEVWDDAAHFPDLEQPERFAAVLIGQRKLLAT